MSSATKCRAQGGVTKCTNPRCPEKRAQAARMAAFYNHPASGPSVKKPAARKVSAKARAAERAMSVPLGWSGETPNWWSHTVAEAQAHPDFPGTPELLDVVDSPAGKVAVVWDEESRNEYDKASTLDSGIGLHVLTYRSFETGETLGYLQLAHVSDDLFDRTFGTDEFVPFRFKERFGGKSMGLRYGEREGDSNRDLSGQALLDQRRKLWYDATYSLRYSFVTDEGEYVPGYQMTRAMTPKDDERIKRDLDQMASDIAPEIVLHRKAYEHPTVHFARLKEGASGGSSVLAGQGFGAAMYVYAARRLGQSGKMLQASGVQSDDAQRLWSRFETQMPERVKAGKTKRRGGKAVSVRRLDFRTSKRAVRAAA